MNFTIFRFDSLSSTNDEAARQAKLGAPEGVCVVARQQTAGRGRRDRTWHSPPDAGLYLSIILRPKFAVNKRSLLTLAAAVAVYDAVLQCSGLATDIKWANDIHSLEGKKLGGILAEVVETKTGNSVVLGIGINLRSTAIAPELCETATSIDNETNVLIDSEELLALLTKALQKYYQILHEENGNETIVSLWTERSSYASNKRVRVQLENESLTGVTRGLQTDGALRLETEAGTIKVIYAGDVIALRPQKTRL